MKLLLLQLSDIHIKTTDDPVLRRIEALVESIQNLDYELAGAVIAVTGDIAFSGEEQQYLIATDLLDRIQQLLKVRLSGDGGNIPVFVVAIPGNHDCNFNVVPEKRDEALKEILQSADASLKEGTIDICTSIQSEFFSFREAIAPLPKEGQKGRVSPKLYYQYRFECQGQGIAVLCCNTAWMSRMREEQGKLLFPPEAIPDRRELRDAALVVACFHHPYNWLSSQHYSHFRARVEEVADIVLTGHEHDPDKRIQLGLSGERNEYIAGGALQDSDDPLLSSFNALIVDLGASKQKFYSMTWNGGMYTPSPADPDWEPYQVNKLRHSSKFEISEHFSEYLDDPGLNLTRADGAKLALPEVYVFPDVKRLPFASNHPGRLVKSDELPAYVEASRALLITGDSQAGRTCLAKSLCRHLLSKGFVPLLLRDIEKLPLDDKLFGFLDGCFKKDYGVKQYEAFRQTDRSRRVVIFDDFHDLQSHRKRRRKLVQQFQKYSGKVILLANDLVLDFDELLPDPDSKDVTDVVELDHLRIQEFGHVLRDRLIERWLQATEGDSLDANAFAYKQSEVKRSIDTIIGRNFVPAYPVYILSVLQAATVGTSLDTKASTHGYYYELFIRNSLAKRRSGIDFDVVTAYLANLAFAFFERHQLTLPLAECEKIHDAFIEKKDIERSFQTLLADLIERRVLTNQANEIGFRYSYQFYYFVALYLRDLLAEEPIRKCIHELAQTIYMEESANILLFLAHLTRDPFVLQEMLDAAESLYKELVPAKLDEDARFLTEFAGQAHALVYRHKDSGQREPAHLRRTLAQMPV